jgi:hypothetical protein
MRSIHIYFCHIPNTEPDRLFRNHLARGCLERWTRDPLAHVVLLQPADTVPLAEGCDFRTAGPADQFHVARYGEPQRAHPDDWFVVADDDCLPLGQSFVERALAVLRGSGEYAVVAALNLLALPNGYPSANQILESHAVGGINFVSPRCPPIPEGISLPAQTDTARYEVVRAAGLKEGYLQQVRMNHLGHGFSTASPSQWGQG